MCVAASSARQVARLRLVALLPLSRGDQSPARPLGALVLVRFHF